MRFGVVGHVHPDLVSGEEYAAVAETRQCAKCDTRPAGPGGVLCVECRQEIEEQQPSYWDPTDASVPESNAPLTGQT